MCTLATSGLRACSAPSPHFNGSTKEESHDSEMPVISDELNRIARASLSARACVDHEVEVTGKD